VNFGPLAAEIGLPVWGTPANFNGFRVLAALLHGTLEVGGGRQPNFAALNRGRRIYSAGRPPSRLASAHILVQYVFRGYWTNFMKLGLSPSTTRSLFDIRLTA